LVILYHEAIFDRTAVKVVYGGHSGGGEGEKLFVVVLRSLFSSDEYQGITSSQPAPRTGEEIRLRWPGLTVVLTLLLSLDYFFLLI
jgi:hypothetical protein